MVQNIQKLLTFFRVVDEHDGKISITNVAVIVVLGKLVFAPQVTIVEAGALFVSLLSYSAKKVINKDAGQPDPEEDTITPQVEELKSKFEEIESKVSTLSLAQGIKKLGGN